MGTIVAPLVFAVATPAAAATFTVSNTNDSGAGSLRDAIDQAAANAEADTILFAAGLADQTITLTTSDDTTFGSSAFGVTADTLVVDGGDAPGLTISGNGAQRIFYVGSGGDLTVTRLTLSGGLALGGSSAANRGGTGGGGAGMGGAVFNEGTFVSQAATFLANEARGGLGSTSHAGGFCGASGGGGPNGGTAGGFGDPGTSGGPGGFGGGGGGGGCSFNGVAGNGGDGGFGGGPGGGGGINGGNGTIGTPGTAGFGGSVGTNGTGTVGGSGGNGASLGGAVFNHGGDVTLVNSTFSQNTIAGGGADGFGGAVFGRNGSLTVTSCTFAENSSDTNGTSVMVVGDAATATLTINDSIFDSNGTGLVASVINGGSTTVTGGTCIVAASSGIPGGIIVSNADPGLGAFADNGGPTQTYGIGPLSPALNAGVCAGVTTDQRGELRPAAGACDIGAFERRLGDSCANAGECPTGFCVDGVCCDVACGNDDPNDCLACSVAEGASEDGACAPLPVDAACGDAAATVCTAADSCDDAGTCLPNDAADDTACDDGSFCTDTDACQSGTCEGSGDPCEADETCSEDMDLCLPNCGNGAMDPNEECDDGNANSDTDPDACRTDCSNPSCGDGVVDTGEDCDDGDDNGGDTCSADCMSVGGSSSGGDSDGSTGGDPSTTTDSTTTDSTTTDSTTTDGASASGTTTATSTTSSTTDDPSSGTDDDTDSGGALDDDGGCSCSTRRTDGRRWIGLVLLLLGVARRRR